MTMLGPRLTGLAPPSPGVEIGALLITAWAVFIAIPLSLGGVGLSWDALNHHVYLGWIADENRFDRDFLAASYQSFQYPYLYWPFYKLFESGISGAVAGAVLASLNLLAVPPLWMLARVCVDEGNWYGMAMRWMAVVLAFLTGVVLSMFNTSANDLLASIPLVWAIALALHPAGPKGQGRAATGALQLMSGLAAGAAVAFKLSNGPLAILMPLLWALRGRTWRQRGASVLWGCAGTAVGFLLLYGYWGYQLWSHYGNPLYPFYDYVFAPIRTWSGWQP